MIGEWRTYRSDDRDLERNDNDLMIGAGENGDWYVSVLPHGRKLGPAVRITTSGTPRGFDRVPAAVAELYAELEAKLLDLTRTYEVVS